MIVLFAVALLLLALAGTAAASAHLPTWIRETPHRGQR